jgi:hypothetical protein
LYEECFISFELEQALGDLLETFPGSCGFACSSVDDEVIRVLGYLGVQDVVNHPVGSFYLPILAVKLLARNCGGRRFEFQQSGSIRSSGRGDFNFSNQDSF